MFSDRKLTRAHPPHRSGHGTARRFLSAALCLGLAALTACEPPLTPLARSATVREAANTVTARAAGEAEFTAVNDGYLLASGGQILTEVDARAKLVLNDGIIIRLAPITLLTNNSSETQWKFRLENGKIWLSLFGGAVVVETGLGTVTMFGNSVEFEYHPGDPANPADDVFVIQCLQGTCRFQDGRSDIQLNDLEQLVVANNGDTVNRLQLSSSQLDEFIDNNPETAGILAGLKLSAPKFTTTAVVVQVPTLAFFAPSGASPTFTSSPSPTRTSTRRAPTATFPFVTLTPTPGGDVPFPTAPNPTSPPGGPPPTGASSPTPQASTSGSTSTPLPTATPITPSPTVPTRTPPPSKTPVPPPTKTPVPTSTFTPLPTKTPVPTDTFTPVPTDTDTPAPTDTFTPAPTDTDTPVPTDTDTPVPTPTT
jgi:hypothetical protein